MTIKSHILGFPRIGAKRELKRGVEAYWRGEISQQELHQIGQKVKEANWQIQHDAGLNFVTVGDFSWYDQVLDASALLGVIPERFGKINGNLDLDTYFCMARGQAPNVKETTACEMTKWFNTNYHYIVPELTINQEFRIAYEQLFDEIKAAQQLGHHVKPVILGPLTYLWLSKTKGHDFDKLSLLEKLIPVYNEIFARLNQLNIKWVQVDEPILILDLPKPWLEAYKRAYSALNFGTTHCLLATYFGAVQENLSVANQLPVHGLHLDMCSAPQNMALPLIVKDKVLSLGVVSGRNIWRTDFEKALAIVQWAKETHGDRLWISTSCSLMHSPVDLDNETLLDAEFKSWLAFAKQKVAEVALLTKVQTSSKAAIADALKENQAAIASRTNSPRVNNQAVQARMKQVMPKQAQRTPYA